MNMYFDTTLRPDLTALVGSYGSGAFASPYRSTVPLLSFFAHERPTVAALLKSCYGSTEATVHFEYKVWSPGAVGNPSQTDAMTISDSETVAIEAKWTEPLYETVGQRLAKRPAHSTNWEAARMNEFREGQRKLLDGWLDLLRRFSERHIELADVEGLVYQLIHRAASACGPCGEKSGREPRLTYLKFDPSPARGSADLDAYREELTQLHGLLGSPKRFPFFVVSVPTEPTPAFEAIAQLPKGQVSTDRSVREALIAGPLFSFGNPVVVRIGE